MLLYSLLEGRVMINKILAAPPQICILGEIGIDFFTFPGTIVTS